MMSSSLSHLAYSFALFLIRGRMYICLRLHSSPERLVFLLYVLLLVIRTADSTRKYQLDANLATQDILWKHVLFSSSPLFQKTQFKCTHKYQVFVKISTSKNWGIRSERASPEPFYLERLYVFPVWMFALPNWNLPHLRYLHKLIILTPRRNGTCITHEY